LGVSLEIGRERTLSKRPITGEEAIKALAVMLCIATNKQYRMPKEVFEKSEECWSVMIDPSSEPEIYAMDSILVSLEKKEPPFMIVDGVDFSRERVEKIVRGWMA
jgi:hypothetical protein